MTYRNAMLDLETLATTADAVVLSIGVAMFDHSLPAALGPTLYAVLDAEEQKALGRRADQDTIRWWSEQPAGARAVFDAPKAKVADALASVSEFLAKHARRDDLLVWGNGADFDNAVLADLYRWSRGLGGLRHGAAGAHLLPWRYHNSRCFRTLKNLLPADFAVHMREVPRLGLHNAEDDAVWQAGAAVRLLRKLGGLKAVARSLGGTVCAG